MDLSVRRLSVYTPTDLVQQVSGGAGTNMNGVEPEDSIAITTGPNRIEWAASVSAGLIDPTSLGLTGSYRIMRVLLLMAAQSTFSIDLVDTSGTFNLASGTTATTFQGEGLGFITSGQKLKITTTGASTTSVKMIVTIADVNCPQPSVK